MAILKIESPESLGLKFGEDCRIEVYDRYGNEVGISGECESISIIQNAEGQSFVYEIDVCS